MAMFRCLKTKLIIKRNIMSNENIASVIVCLFNIGDELKSTNTNEIYTITAIGKRKCLVEIISKIGGSHEFERRIEEVNKYHLNKR